jgi:transglutaminase-like putative cysteine protease
MKRIRIVHDTAYHYSAPVTFGPHRAMLRPREGHDLRIVSGRLDVEPKATVRWLRDIYGNSIALITFAEPARKLHVYGEVDVDLPDNNAVECQIDPAAKQFPFQYAPEEQIELIHYRIPSYPYEGARLQHWLRDVYQPGQIIGTFELLEKLNHHIHTSLGYARREEYGVQLPCNTIDRGSGSCRDFAVLMMEAVRYWGFGARFVTGYIQMGEGQHGATHAWTEVYIPGIGWQGFDPTNDKRAGTEHVAVAVAREQEKASPLSGTWDGPNGSFERMDVSVQVFEV